MLIIFVVFGKLLQDRFHNKTTMGLGSVKTRLNIDAFLLFVSNWTSFASSGYSNLVNIKSSHTLGDNLLPIMNLSISYFEIPRLIFTTLVPKMLFELSTALILVLDEVDFEPISLECHLLLRNFLYLVLLESEVAQISVMASATTSGGTEHIIQLLFPIAQPFLLEHLLWAAQKRRLFA